MTPALAAAVLVCLSVPALGAAGERPAPPQPQSIAVLDFVNRNPGDGRDWLGKGLADMVITDLSASGRLTVLDRERMQEVARELEAMTTGLFDERTAPRAGRIAKAHWVLFGSFSCRADRIALEALLIDVTKPQTLRIEQVEGPLAKVFGLEQRLVAPVLAKLDAPMTEQELRLVKLLKTESLPAFEHYSRALGLFDRGQWYDALVETRLAVKADPGYAKAAMRLADLYHDVGEPDHAMVEYHRLAELDREERLPDGFYLRMARVLDEALADRASGLAVLQRIVRRHKDDAVPFRVTDPPRYTRYWDGVSYLPARLCDPSRSRLAYWRTLDLMAKWERQAGRYLEAAQLLSRIVRFVSTQERALSEDGAVTHPFVQDVMGRYAWLYWRLVLENRDATLYPPETLYVLPEQGATLGPETKLHYRGRKGFPVCLAPPGFEIAQVRYAMHFPSPEKLKKMFGTRGGGVRECDFKFQCMGRPDILLELGRVEPDGAWHVLDLKPGIRALDTYVGFTDRWQMQFSLRKWSPGRTPQPPDVGTVELHVFPAPAWVFLDGQPRGQTPSRAYGPKAERERPKDLTDILLIWKSLTGVPTGRHTVEARWPDGRTASGTVLVEQGRETSLMLNADTTTVARQVLARRGSHTCLMLDRAGRLWLLWDDDMAHKEDLGQKVGADLYAATTTDGVQWARPRRLPVSSMARDAHPVLQQDPRGRLWLVWESDRDPEAPRSLWIASSPNGVEWTFPRKLAPSEPELDVVTRWRRHARAQLRPDGAAPRDDGAALSVTPHQWGLLAREFVPTGGEPRSWWAESFRVAPFHPSIACLPSGRMVVAYGSTEGLIATAFQRTHSEAKNSGTRQDRQADTPKRSGP